VKYLLFIKIGHLSSVIQNLFFYIEVSGQENEEKKEELDMKVAVAVLLGGLVLGNMFLDSHIQDKESAEVLIVYYFGATDFGFCTAQENIEKIKKIKTDLSDKYGNKKTKFVMVCMDKDIKKGLKFIQKYGYWDEISIGSFYDNELALAALNASPVPKVPHLMVFKDIHSIGKWSLPLLKERTLLVDLAGGEQISEWIRKTYPVPFINNSKEEK
jgi:hypothetical protein